MADGGDEEIIAILRRAVADHAAAPPGRGAGRFSGSGSGGGDDAQATGARGGQAHADDATPADAGAGPAANPGGDRRDCAAAGADPVGDRSARPAVTPDEKAAAGADRGRQGTSEAIGQPSLFDALGDGDENRARHPLAGAPPATGVETRPGNAGEAGGGARPGPAPDGRRPRKDPRGPKGDAHPAPRMPVGAQEAPSAGSAGMLVAAVATGSHRPLAEPPVATHPSVRQPSPDGTRAAVAAAATPAANLDGGDATAKGARSGACGPPSRGAPADELTLGLGDVTGGKGAGPDGTHDGARGRRRKESADETMRRNAAAEALEGHRRRLRDRFDRGEQLADYEVLELLLTLSIPRRDTKPLAKALVRRFGSLAAALAAPTSQLSEVDGVGPRVTSDFRLVRQCAERFARAELEARKTLGSTEVVVDYFRTKLRGVAREEFHVLYLDKKNGFLAAEKAQEGTVDHTPVYPREVLRRAIELGASALVLVHNHPSGDPTPSRADVAMTQKIVEAVAPVGITVHDHLVIGGNDYVSLRGSGLM